MPSGIGSWRELGVEVQQCPLRPGAGEVARSGGEGQEEEEEEEEGGAESYLKT